MVGNWNSFNCSNCCNVIQSVSEIAPNILTGYQATTTVHQHTLFQTNYYYSVVLFTRDLLFGIYSGSIHCLGSIRDLFIVWDLFTWDLFGIYSCLGSIRDLFTWELFGIYLLSGIYSGSTYCLGSIRDLFTWDLFGIYLLSGIY